MSVGKPDSASRTEARAGSASAQAASEPDDGTPAEPEGTEPERAAADPATRDPSAPESAAPESAVSEEAAAAKPRRTPTSIGARLTAARREAGLTVGQVSERTRVRGSIVEAIERDDFSRCGGDAYARGHLRSLARATGLDPEPLVADFDREHDAAEGPLVSPIFENRRVRSERRRPSWTIAMVAAIVAVLAFAAVNLTSSGKKDDHHTAASAAPSVSASPSASPSAAAPSSHPPTKKASHAPAAVPTDKVVVRLTVTGKRSWIGVRDGSGKSLAAMVLDHGQSKTFTDAKQLNLNLGNAGAVKLTVNGQDLGSAGAKGQVRQLRFTPGVPEMTPSARAAGNAH